MLSFKVKDIFGERKMTAEQRKQKISELLKENDSVKVTELSRLFGVSEVTVRAYLEDMEKKGQLSHVSRVQLCATPQTAAQQAPLSLGFSRQEHWSGLPFPSPMHESEK